MIPYNVADSEENVHFREIEYALDAIQLFRCLHNTAAMLVPRSGIWASRDAGILGDFLAEKSDIRRHTRQRDRSMIGLRKLGI